MLALRVAMLLCFALSGLPGCGQPTLKSHGGYVLTYRLAPDQEGVDHQQMAEAMQQRLRSAGLRSAAVRVTKDNQFLVELPAAVQADANRAEQQLELAGHLELRIVAERGQDDAVIEAALAAAEKADEAPAESYRWVSMTEEQVTIEDWMVLRDTANGDREILVLVSDDDVFGSDFGGVAKGIDQNLQPCIDGILKGEGAFKMGMLTSGNIKRRLGIIFDDKLLSAPVIQSKIVDRLQVTGDFSSEHVDSIILALRAGAFPARLEKSPVSIEKIDPE